MYSSNYDRRLLKDVVSVRLSARHSCDHVKRFKISEWFLTI